MVDHWSNARRSIPQLQARLGLNAGLFEAEALKEAERFFEWALSYERKGLHLAADAMRDEGRKVLQTFIAQCS